MKRTKFILVDDNEPFRAAMSMILIYKYNAEIIADVSNAEAALQIKNIYQADIILMDILIPGKNGIELTKDLLWKNNNLKIIAITMQFDKVYLTTLIGAGFKGCVFKNNIFNELGCALDSVNMGNLYFPDNILIDHNIKL